MMDYYSHAQQCRDMAKLMHHPAMAARWNEAAEHWLRCARQEEAMRPSDAKLSAALHEAGLKELAARAERGYYNEYFGALATPELVLAKELAEIGTVPALAVRSRLINGDFDAGRDESEEWARSKEGKSALRKLARRK